MWLEDLQEALRRGLNRTVSWPSLTAITSADELTKIAQAAIEEAVRIARTERLDAQADADSKTGQQHLLASIRALGHDPKGLRRSLAKHWLAPGVVVGPPMRRLAMRGFDAGLPPSAVAKSCQLALKVTIVGPAALTTLDDASLPLEPYLSLPNQTPYDDVLVYAEELGLMRSGQTTPIGRVLADLRGREAVGWLLENELLRTTGPKDPWRLSKTTVEALLSEPDRVVRSLLSPDPNDEVDFPHDWEVLQRLARLGLLTLEHGAPDESAYRVFPDGQSLLRELLASNPSVRAALGALVEEEAARTISGRSMYADLDRGAAEWVIETMAHGLRNALVPVTIDLNGLAEDSSDPHSDVLMRAHAGVSRALKLVGDLAALYQSAQAPPERFELSRALSDAALAANGEGTELDIEACAGFQLPGRRLRLVHAVAELIRNARQHPTGTNPVQVRLRAQLAPGGIDIHVEDDGTGVPPDLHHKIFERGFSTKPEGTGQGLALLREVVQGELGGRLSVARSADLGGAQFTLHLPIEERS